MSGIIIRNVTYAHKFWVWDRDIETDGLSVPLYYAWYTPTPLFHDEGKQYIQFI